MTRRANAGAVAAPTPRRLPRHLASFPEAGASLAPKHFAGDRLDRRPPGRALVFGTRNAILADGPVIWIKNSRQSRIRRGPRTRFNAYNGFHRARHVTQFPCRFLGPNSNAFQINPPAITKPSEPVYRRVGQCYYCTGPVPCLKGCQPNVPPRPSPFLDLITAYDAFRQLLMYNLSLRDRASLTFSTSVIAARLINFPIEHPSD